MPVLVERILLAAIFLSTADRPRPAAVEWKPVTPEEHVLTSVPGAPKAPAICLFSEVFTDDTARQEHHYIRIEILKRMDAPVEIFRFLR